MSLHYFSLYHGKHEDQSLASLSVRHADGFETPLAAMLDFRRVLMEHVAARPGRKLKKCCKSQPEDHNFCPKCNTDLRPPDPERIAGEVVDLYLKLFGEATGTLDKAASLLRRFEEHGWELSYWGLPAEPPVEIVNVDRWLDWIEDGEDGSEPMPFMEATFPDETTWSTFDEERD